MAKLEGIKETRDQFKKHYGQFYQKDIELHNQIKNITFGRTKR